MGIFTVKTDGFQTTGLNFNALKDKLDAQVEQKKLGQDAQLRFTEGKGLYAKSETWNLSGYAPFGSGVVLRGNKFLAAREEIARSINFGYGFQLHEGKLIGDYVVDKVLTDRAREEMGVEPDENVSPEELERKKRNIYLKVSDLEKIQEEITKITDRLNGGGRLLAFEEQNRPELVSTVGYMGGKPRPGGAEAEATKDVLDTAVRRETQKIIDAVAEDLAAHKWARLDPKKRDQLDRDGLYELNKKHHADAEREARTLLDHMGMKTDFRDKAENEKEINVLEGGLSARNLARISFLLHMDGVVDKNVMALLQCTDLPRHVSGCGERLFDLDRRLEDCASAVHDATVYDQLERRLGDQEAQKIDHGLRAVSQKIRDVVQENRAIIVNLKRMSYPEDVTDWNLRQNQYNSLIENIKLLDDALTHLKRVVELGGYNLTIVAGERISGLVDMAQAFCAETLELASGVRPMLPAGREIERQPRPFDIGLPGLMTHRTRGDVNFYIDASLSGEIKAPDILFKADSMGQSNVRTLTRGHNSRVKEINQEFQEYLSVATDLRGGITREEKTYVNQFRKKLAQALRDNERLTEVMRRRQKILGEHAHEGINEQLKLAEDQRNALLLLLYPRLTRPAPEKGAPVRQNQRPTAHGPDLALDALVKGSGSGVGVEEQESDDSSSASTDPNTDSEIRIEESRSQVQIEPSVQQVTIKVVSDKPVLDYADIDLPEDDDGDLGVIRPRGGLAADMVIDNLKDVRLVGFDAVDAPQNAGRAVNAPDVGAARGKNVTWRRIQDSVMQDWASIKSLHIESSLWLDDLKNKERLLTGQASPYSVIKDAVDQNHATFTYIDAAIEDNKLVFEHVWSTALRELWNSFGLLVTAKQGLQEFIDEQTSRLSSKELKENSQARSKAEAVISAAETARKNIEKFITSTHSAAYALSPPERRKQIENLMHTYPKELAMTIDPSKLNNYHIDGRNHNLAGYAKNETIGRDEQYADQAYVSNQDLARGYLRSLDAVHATLSDLKEVRSDAHRQRRVDMLEQELIPRLNEALKQNTDVMGEFKDREFLADLAKEEILNERQAEDLLSRLAQDRSNIENLRLDAYTLLYGDSLRQKAA